VSGPPQVTTGSFVTYWDEPTQRQYKIADISMPRDTVKGTRIFRVGVIPFERDLGVTVTIYSSAAKRRGKHDISEALFDYLYEGMEKRLSPEALRHIQDCYADWCSKL